MSGAYWYFTHPRRVVAKTPEDLRPHALDVYRTAPDGATLHAIWLRAAGAGSDRTIIQHHGYNGAAGLLMADDHLRLMAWPFVRAARDGGYNLLLIDARAHGLSEGPWIAMEGSSSRISPAGCAGCAGNITSSGSGSGATRWVPCWGCSWRFAQRQAAWMSLFLTACPSRRWPLFRSHRASAAVVVQPVVRRLTMARAGAFSRRPPGREVLRLAARIAGAWRARSSRPGASQRAGPQAVARSGRRRKLRLLAHPGGRSLAGPARCRDGVSGPRAELVRPLVFRRSSGCS